MQVKFTGLDDSFTIEDNSVIDENDNCKPVTSDDGCTEADERITSADVSRTVADDGSTEAKDNFFRFR
jgi:hypothetical protein